jgi:hypothetical protein
LGDNDTAGAAITWGTVVNDSLTKVVKILPERMKKLYKTRNLSAEWLLGP